MVASKPLALYVAVTRLSFVSPLTVSTVLRERGSATSHEPRAHLLGIGCVDGLDAALPEGDVLVVDARPGGKRGVAVAVVFEVLVIDVRDRCWRDVIEGSLTEHAGAPIVERGVGATAVGDSLRVLAVGVPNVVCELLVAEAFLDPRSGVALMRGPSGERIEVAYG